MAGGGSVRPADAAAALNGDDAAAVTVEVVYSPCAGAVDRVSLCLPPGSSVADALRHSGLADRYPALHDAVAAGRVGVWGRRRSPQQPLSDGDRVEVCRPLQVDPMQARRDRQRRQAAAARREAAARVAPAPDGAGPAASGSPRR